MGIVSSTHPERERILNNAFGIKSKREEQSLTINDECNHHRTIGIQLTDYSILWDIRIIQSLYSIYDMSNMN